MSAWGLLAVGDVALRFRRFRYANPAEAFLRRDDNQAEAFTEDDLYGLRGVPWTLWRIAGAVVGTTLAYLLLAERNPLFAALGLAGAFAPHLLRAYLVRRRQVDVDRQVRDFIFLLRPALSVLGGLRPALEEVAARLEPSVVRERLCYHLERAFSVDPASVVQDLAQDIRSEELENLLLGITAAQKGGMGYGEAVIRAAEEASERIREEARIAIEETPVRMIIPMLLLLVPPFLVLALYPLLARLLALLNAPAGSAGGLW
jgi:Flp pilus assembly protein TadB